MLRRYFDDFIFDDYGMLLLLYCGTVCRMVGMVGMICGMKLLCEEIIVDMLVFEIYSSISNRLKLY